MGKMSRPKGNAAEREVAKILCAWWRNLEPNCEFIRTPLSGGWSTQKVRSEFQTSGDLMTTAEHFPFVVEVKRREGWSLENFLKGKKSPVWGWWEQACEQAENEKKTPLLIFRQSRMEWRVLFVIDQAVMPLQLESGDCFDAIDKRHLVTMPFARMLQHHPNTFVQETK